MKVLFKSDFRGWVNFGTNYQRWENPFTVEISEKTGKVYIRSEGKLTKAKSPTEYKLGGKNGNKYIALDMTEKEANKVYSHLA